MLDLLPKFEWERDATNTLIFSSHALQLTHTWLNELGFMVELNLISLSLNCYFNYCNKSFLERDVFELNACTKYKPLVRLCFSTKSTESSMLLFKDVW